MQDKNTSKCFGQAARSCPSRTVRAAITALAMAASGVSAAQSSQDGTISQLRVRATDGLVSFVVDGPRSPPPACATQPNWVLANESSVSGRQQFAALTMAHAAGKRVTVYGTGFCARAPDAENVAEIVVWD